MPRGVFAFVGIVVVALASSATGRAAAAPPCATVGGPVWSQTIDLAADGPPPKTAELRAIHGARYYVFVDHVSCRWAKGQVARLLTLKSWAVARTSPPVGYVCFGQRGWFRDVFNGDAVRRTSPSVAAGTCTTIPREARMIRVLVGGDNEAVRDGICQARDEEVGIEVVATWADLPSLRVAVAEARPACSKGGEGSSRLGTVAP